MCYNIANKYKIYLKYVQGDSVKLATIGSRNLMVKNIGDYIPKEVGEIVSGGAKGVDTCAADYAKRNYIKLTEFFPDYNK
jgi:hypothetical protein